MRLELGAIAPCWEPGASHRKRWATRPEGLSDYRLIAEVVKVRIAAVAADILAVQPTKAPVKNPRPPMVIVRQLPGGIFHRHGATARRQTSSCSDRRDGRRRPGAICSARHPVPRSGVHAAATTARYDRAATP